VVEIACVEGLADEWAPGGPGPESRPGRNPWLGHDAHVCRYRARNGVQTFERFEWCAIRWMQVTVRDAPQGLLFRGLGANLANYPARTLGRFSSSDPMLDRLWSLGAYTLRQCMHDSWEDCPSREQRQWLGDVAVENLVGWAAFGPQVAPLTANFLLQAAESQRPDGLTQMFAPGDHRINGLLIPDWTLQWILVAGDHYDHSGDLATIRTIFPSILKALAWFEPLIAPSGLAADIPYWRFIDWAGLGREGEASAINAELAGAFRVASRLAGALGWPSEAERLAARSEVIGAAIQRRCWDERRGVFVDVVDPVTGERQVRVSQHANAAIALWTQAPPERIARALDRISQSERLVFTAAPPIAPTGETLDPQEDVVLANTFFSHFVYLALARHGRWADAVKLMRERFGPMLERGATTLWESFAPTASLCHGFSATPTYQLSRHVLGVRPDSPGFSRLSFGPDLADLSHAEGVVPVSAGDVEVHVEMDGERMVGRCRHPKEVEVRVDPAPGWTIVSQSAPSVGGIEAMFERTL
ncbi:MAG: MGH1-like glycoside hydrolase domain-containing protein, partial [Caulobacteraceae bacterium]